MEFDEAMQRARRWIDEYEWVHGIAEGEEDGERCISVFVSDVGKTDELPERLGPFRVTLEESGPFHALS